MRANKQQILCFTKQAVTVENKQVWFHNISVFATVGIITAIISVLITFFVCSIYLFHIQEYQKHMEAFDQNVANVTTWMYRAEILLDESDKQKPQQKEESLKVKKNVIFWKALILF